MLWTFTPVDELEVSDNEKMREFVNMADVRVPRPIAENRLRKEYRTLTLSERTRLHAAFNRLYDVSFARIYVAFKMLYDESLTLLHEDCNKLSDV